MVVFSQDETLSFIYGIDDLFVVDRDVYKDNNSINSYIRIGTFNSFAEAKECLEDMAFEYSSGKATNEMQCLGSSITYMRRYLYMMALDICEADSIDANIGKGESAPTAPAAEKKAPATPQERQEVKQELTKPSENASALQIKGLKNVLKKLKDADPSKEEMIAEIAGETEGFTKISKSDCEAIIQKITAMVEGGK